MYFSTEKQIKRSTRDVPSTRTTTGRRRSRTPCTTQTRKLLRGRWCASTPTSTLSAPWFDVRCSSLNTSGETTCFVLRHNVEADVLTRCWFAAKMQFCSKHKAHFQQQFKMLQISAFITWNMEEGGRVTHLLRSCLFALCECRLLIGK